MTSALFVQTLPAKAPFKRRRQPSCCASDPGSPAPPTTASIPLPDNASLVVDTYSDAARHPRRTVVLIHDFMTDRRLFRRLASTSHFSHCTALAADLRAFGASPPPTPSTPYNHPDDLSHVVKNTVGTLPQAPSKVDVVGVGFGGAVALEWALRDPGLVRSVAVVNSGLPGHQWRAPHKLFVDVSEARLAGRLIAAVGLEEASKVVGDAVDVVKWKRKFISTNETWNRVLKQGEKAVARQLLQMAKDYSGFHFFYDDPVVPRPFDHVPLIDRLCDVEQPVAVVVGDADTPDFLQISDEIARLVPSVWNTVNRVKGAGHFAVLEQPQLVASTLDSFWRHVDSVSDGDSESNS